jgi:uncharacterized membrane protein YhhN
MSISITVVTSVVSVCGLLWAETSGHHSWSWLFKPIAAACFIALGLQAGALDSSYGQILLAGLVACWFGDVFLIPNKDLSFLIGLGSFLVGHLLYAAAFTQLSGATTPMLVSMPPATLLALLSLRWMWGHLPADMKIPVICYVTVISTMLVCAANAWDSELRWWILGGAWGFALSDIAVARQQFVRPGAINRLWGTPLYFGSQMVLAYTPFLLAVD